MLAYDEKGDNIYWMDFENWKKDGRAELERMWKWLGWSFKPTDSEIALVRHEKHKNDD